MNVVAIGISFISIILSLRALYYSKKGLINQKVIEDFYQPFKDELQLLLTTLESNSIIKIDQKNYKLISEICETEKKNYFKKRDRIIINKAFETIKLYNDNKLINYTRKLLIQQFEKGFETLYGSIVEYEEPIYDNDNEIVAYDDHYYLPVELIHTHLTSKEICSIIESIGCFENIERYEIEHDEYIEYNKYQSIIYNSCLNIIYNQEKYKFPDTVIDSYCPALIYITTFDNIDENISKSSEYHDKLNEKRAVCQLVEQIIKIVNKINSNAYKLFRRI